MVNLYHALSYCYFHFSLFTCTSWHLGHRLAIFIFFFYSLSSFYSKFLIQIFYLFCRLLCLRFATCSPTSSPTLVFSVCCPCPLPLPGPVCLSSLPPAPNILRQQSLCHLLGIPHHVFVHVQPSLCSSLLPRQQAVTTLVHLSLDHTLFTFLPRAFHFSSSISLTPLSSLYSTPPLPLSLSPLFPLFLLSLSPSPSLSTVVPCGPPSSASAHSCGRGGVFPRAGCHMVLSLTRGGAPPHPPPPQPPHYRLHTLTLHQACLTRNINHNQS